MNTLNIISDNYRQFILITPENINFYNFPDNWKLIFHAENFSLQKEIVIELWNSIFEQELSRTISFMTQNLISIKFIETGFGISMVYIMNEEGKISCMESYIPNKNLDKWGYLPKKLLDFYEVFNGWTLPETQFMGLLPIESVKPIFEDSDKSCSKFKDFIVVFKNGGGGYLCFDKNNIKNSMVWWSDGEPMVELNLWDFLDEWILMGLTELS